MFLPSVRYDPSSSRTKKKHINIDEDNNEEKEGFINEDEYRERTVAK